MKVTIPHRWRTTPCAVVDVADDSETPMRDAVVSALLTGAHLTDARLTGARLTGANLTGADLIGANLIGADLIDADLTGANLTGARLIDADLTGADLIDADLTGADLIDADLTGANLTGARLTGANLTGADLIDADLTGANLTGARDDFRKILDLARPEVTGLLLAIREGRVDGSCYEGECACLVGTIGNLRGVAFDHLDGIRPDSARPAERLFMAISPGHVPAINPVAKIVEGWIVEWQAENQGTGG